MKTMIKSMVLFSFLGQLSNTTGQTTFQLDNTSYLNYYIDVHMINNSSCPPTSGTPITNLVALHEYSCGASSSVTVYVPAGYYVYKFAIYQTVHLIPPACYAGCTDEIKGNNVGGIDCSFSDLSFNNCNNIYGTTDSLHVDWSLSNLTIYD